MSSQNSPGPTRLDEAGLPENASIVQCFYNRASRKTIIEVRLFGTPPLHRLYWRTPPEIGYQLLADPGAMNSLENALNCESSWLFVRKVAWKDIHGGFGASTESVLRLNLNDPPSMTVLDVADFLPPNANVVRLLGVNDGGDIIQAVVMMKDAKEDATRGKRVRYMLCTLDLTNRALLELDHLRGIQF